MFNNASQRQNVYFLFMGNVSLRENKASDGKIAVTKASKTHTHTQLQWKIKY